MYSYIAKSVFNDPNFSSTDPCYIQNCVIMNRVIKRLRCTIYHEIVDRIGKSVPRVTVLWSCWSLYLSINSKLKWNIGTKPPTNFCNQGQTDHRTRALFSF